MPRVQENTNVNQTICGIEECKKLIPIFDPSQKNGVSAYDWLSNIESVKSMFSWSDTSTLFYASLRLEEAASSWFAAVKNDKMTWEEFKKSLIEAFPAVRDTSQLYVQIMQRTKKKEESIEKYFYDVLGLARQGGFSDFDTKNFVVSGLDDAELISAMATIVPNCKSNNELLAQIKVHMGIIQQQRSRSQFSGRNLIQETRVNIVQNQRKDFSKFRATDTRTCYNCRQVGHIARDCKKRKYNNNSRQNEYNNGPAHKISKISVGKSSGLIKTVSIGNNNLKAFIDLGSECSTLKLSKARQLGLEFEKSNIKLTGFGNNSVYAMGKLSTLVTIMEVAVNIDIYVVNDGYQEHDMIIGQNFLDHSGVRSVWESGELSISFSKTNKN